MNKLTLPLLALATASIFSGCASPKNATYVDPKGTDTIVSLNKINIQDWNQAADLLVADLMASGVLERAPEQPAVLAISRITNKTSNQVDINSLTKKIRVALMQSGKVLTTSLISYDGVEDPLAKELGAQQGATTPKPYYTLSGLLLEDKASAGKINQITYTFQLSLTTVKDGLAVWESEQQITKMGKQSTVGW